MKHTLKITILVLLMFIITQLIGIFVVGHYSQPSNEIPYGMSPPEPEQESDFLTSFLPSIVIAFVIAVLLLFVLSKINAEFVLKLWFFVVVAVTLGISFASFIPDFMNKALLTLIIALPLAFFKIYRPNFLVHNITEFFVYPGIAAIFVPLLNLWTAIILLFLISLYDMWAVWRVGIMQKMANYQINKLKIFSGFFVPYLPRKTKAKIKKMKKSDLKKKKFKINLAILGGGDVVFPIIAAGVALGVWGIYGALLTTLGAVLGLGLLLLFSEKKKSYPAMPLITAGVLLMYLINWLVF